MDTLPHPLPRSLLTGLALLALPALLHAQLPSADASVRTAVAAGASMDGALEIAVPAEGATLRPGQVLVIASWACAFLQLERVNQLGLNIIEEPLTQLVQQGRLGGWGQFNGEFRDEYNYHTFYIAESLDQYRAALSRVLNHVAGAAQDDMAEFYQHCSRTRELSVRVVTAKP